MRWYIPLLLLAVPLLVLGCTDDDTDNGADTDTTAVATEAAMTPESTEEGAAPDATADGAAEPDATVGPFAFGSVEGLREILQQGTGLDANMIDDVDFQGETLMITLVEDESIVQGDVESTCDQLSQEIELPDGLPDFEIAIQSSAGEELARCSPAA